MVGTHFDQPHRTDIVKAEKMGYDAVRICGSLTGDLKN